MTEQDRQMQMQALAKELEPANWNTLTLEKRVDLMQRVENFQAELQNRPPCVVKAEPMATNQRGYYYNHQIVQNQDMVKYTDSSNMCLQNVIHEGRHAYQYDTVLNPQNHLEVSNETLAAWTSNLAPGNYISAKVDSVAYFQQPVEMDARSYAEAQSLAYTQSLNVQLSEGETSSQSLEASQSSAQTMDNGPDNTGEGNSGLNTGEGESNSAGESCGISM